MARMNNTEALFNAPHSIRFQTTKVIYSDNIDLIWNSLPYNVVKVATTMLF